jgi:hypothetical protein
MTKNIYIEKMKECNGKENIKAETFKVLQEASRDDNLTLRQFANVVKARKEVLNG